jgi:hypothetical protein
MSLLTIGLYVRSPLRIRRQNLVGCDKRVQRRGDVCLLLLACHSSQHVDVELQREDVGIDDGVTVEAIERLEVDTAPGKWASGPELRHNGAPEVGWEELRNRHVLLEDQVVLDLEPLLVGLGGDGAARVFGSGLGPMRRSGWVMRRPCCLVA